MTILWLLLPATAYAQSNLIDSLISDAASIYNIATSVLAPDTTSESQATTASDVSSATSPSTSTPAPASSASSSSSVSTASESRSSSLSDITSSITSLSSSPTQASATQTGASAQNATSDNSGGGGSSNTLAIVLGCTLGALALAAFLALLFFCLRRRRKIRASGKHRPLSPNDDESASWRPEKSFARSFKGPATRSRDIIPGNDAAPLMTERSHEHHTPGTHQNPFVPVPPPARRSSRAGLQATGYSAHPYSPDHVNGLITDYGYHQGLVHHDQPHEDHHGGRLLAMGAGAAALGGLAAHARDRHDRKRSESRGRKALNAETAYTEDEHNALPQATDVGRRSGSVSRVNAKEPWPFVGTKSRQSTESKRSRSRSEEYYATPDQYPQDTAPDGDPLAADGSARPVVESSRYYAAGAHNGRKGILKHNRFDVSEPSSLDSSGASSGHLDPYPAAHNSGPHELASADIPATPVTRGRPNSMLGEAAPIAAMGAIGLATGGQGRSGSSPRTSRADLPTLTIPQTPEPDSRRPSVPSRSPKRRSMDSRARYSSINNGTAEASAEPPNRDLVSPPLVAQEQGSYDHDGIISPVSPITNSNPGTWTKAQADELGMGVQNGPSEQGSSQDSTVIGSTSPDLVLDNTRDHQSSGLVSTIQRIFSSQKAAWAEDAETSKTKDRPRRFSFEDIYEDHDDQEHKIMSVPHRRPAAARNSLQHTSHHGEIDSPYVTGETVVHHNQEEISPQPHRRSAESSRSGPPAYRPNQDLAINTTATADFAPIPATSSPLNPSRPRRSSRPGYGFGSGDPFDLASSRTDSSMTGISLSNYQEPPHNKSRTSTGSNNGYREPTLAELRYEVQQEDRQRIRQKWMHRHNRSNSSGLRNGDDRELFSMLDEMTHGTTHDDSDDYPSTQAKSPRRVSAGASKAY